MLWLHKGVQMIIKEFMAQLTVNVHYYYHIHCASSDEETSNTFSDYGDAVYKRRASLADVIDELNFKRSQYSILKNYNNKIHLAKECDDAFHNKCEFSKLKMQCVVSIIELSKTS